MPHELDYLLAMVNVVIGHCKGSMNRVSYFLSWPLVVELIVLTQFQQFCFRASIKAYVHCLKFAHIYVVLQILWWHCKMMSCAIIYWRMRFCTSLIVICSPWATIAWDGPFHNIMKLWGVEEFANLQMHF